MGGSSWVAVLRQIPPALQEHIVIVTTTATEIMVNRIMRLEREHLVARGRMAGSTDNGRLIFIPYDQIVYAGINKKLLEAEEKKLLGKPGVSVQFVESGTAGQAEEPPADFDPTDFVEDEAPAEVPQAAPPEPPAPEPAANATPKPEAPSRATLLARLRARLAADPPRQSDP